MAFIHSMDSDDPKAGLVEVTGRIIMSTEKALLVDDGRVRGWLPKRSVAIEDEPDGRVTVTMKQWLAREKGFL